MADTPDLGSGAVRREGSSPSPSTLYSKHPRPFVPNPSPSPSQRSSSSGILTPRERKMTWEEFQFSDHSRLATPPMSSCSPPCRALVCGGRAKVCCCAVSNRQMPSRVINNVNDRQAKAPRKTHIVRPSLLVTCACLRLMVRLFQGISLKSFYKMII